MPFSKGGGGIDQLTGDVLAGPGTGAQSSALAAVGTAGTVGDASHYPVITTDAKGRVTGMTATAIPAGVSPATTVAGPDAYGAAAAVGTGTLYARNDHNHGLPAAPAVSLTTFQEHLTASVNLGNGSSTGFFTWITSVTTFQVGTYLVFLNGSLKTATGSISVQVGSGQVANGTGTATSVAIMDPLGASSNVSLATSSAYYEHNVVLVVTVTVAGTLAFQWYVNPNAQTPVISAGSGFIAMKIA